MKAWDEEPRRLAERGVYPEAQARRILGLPEPRSLVIGRRIGIILGFVAALLIVFVIMLALAVGIGALAAIAVDAFRDVLDALR